MGRVLSWVFGIFALLLLLTVFIGPIVLLPVQLLAYLAAGWTMFLWRIAESIEFDWQTIAFSLMCLAIFTAGLHAFIRWLANAVSEARAIESHPWKWRWTFGIIGILVTAFAAGISMVGVSHQIIWLAKSEQIFADGYRLTNVRQANSSHNLQGTARAADVYAFEHAERLPTDIVGPQSHYPHPWVATLLPYLGQMELFEKIDVRAAWDSAGNARVYKERLYFFENPGIRGRKSNQKFPLADYSGNVHVLGGVKGRTLNDIKDGAAQTIFAGEITSERKPWGQPKNWRDPAIGLNSANGFAGPWNGASAQFSFVDGSVRYIDGSIHPKVLRALATPDGGEQINDESY